MLMFVVGLSSLQKYGHKRPTTNVKNVPVAGIPVLVHLGDIFCSEECASSVGRQYCPYYKQQCFYL
jgi:hypothetical protein